MPWFLIAVVSYFFSALATLIDKYLLSGPLSHPRVYVFYIGALSLLSLVFSPLGFSMPALPQLFLALISGALSIYGLLWFFEALSLFEASRVVPAIGGMISLFVFILTLFAGEGVFGLKEGAAFILLISGLVLITLERGKGMTLKSLQMSLVAAFLFSLSFFTSKIVYLDLLFWSGFIWMRIGGFIFSLSFLLSGQTRREIFLKRLGAKKGPVGIFFLGQTLGAIAALLQSWAIALVPFGFLTFVNALEGTKYVFLLIFAMVISAVFPRVLKEEFSRQVIIQKIIAVLLIGLGLASLSLK